MGPYRDPAAMPVEAGPRESWWTAGRVCWAIVLVTDVAINAGCAIACWPVNRVQVGTSIAINALVLGAGALAHFIIPRIP